MKYLILIFTTFTMTFCNAQSFENKKMLTTTLTTFNINSSTAKASSGSNPSQKTSTYGFGFRPEFTFGKVNSKNRLFAYGIGIEVASNTQKPATGETIKDNRFGIFPMVMFQKFIPLANKFYLTPAVRIRVGYEQGSTKNSQTSLKSTTKGFISTLFFNPASLTYSLKTNTNIILFLGNISLDFSHSTYDFDPNINSNKGSSTNFSFTGNVNSIGIGFQKIL